MRAALALALGLAVGAPSAGCGQIRAGARQVHVERRLERVAIGAIADDDEPTRPPRPGDTHVELARETKTEQRASAAAAPMTLLVLGLGVVTLAVIGASAD